MSQCFKCNGKMCVYCTHFCTKTTITSYVNGRQFSVVNNNELHWPSGILGSGRKQYIASAGARESVRIVALSIRIHEQTQ